MRVRELDAKPGPDTTAVRSNREKVGLTTAGQETRQK